MARFLIAMFLLLLSRSAFGETVQLQCPAGVCLVPVRINNAITINFLLDTGASYLAVPADVVLTLIRTETLKTSDFIGTETVRLADGSTQQIKRFVLREVQVGSQVVRNVTAGVNPVQGPPLLGQSFLSKLPAWTIDNQRHVLVFNDVPGSIASEQTAALRPPQPPQASSPTQAAAGASSLSAAELVGRARQAHAAKNYSEAMRWYQMAASQGSAPAEEGIGTLYENGSGTSQDFAQAMRWYRMAADQGYAAAQNKIGVMYQRGWAGSQNYAEAIRWFQMAAAQGDATAQTNIGTLYENGAGVSKDYTEAMRWFRMAAAQGFADAQNKIGVLYQRGWGVPPNAAEAVRWFEMAAAQGYAPAQSNLGWMIARGQGATKDCAAAKPWLEKAAAAGNDLARNGLSNGANGACPW